MGLHYLVASCNKSAGRCVVSTVMVVFLYTALGGGADARLTASFRDGAPHCSPVAWCQLGCGPSQNMQASERLAIRGDMSSI
ncbi:hypothetical protein BDV33DRAFT_184948 [Aspergillus novoparasiticus]|uniref:Uncharacterized protein n=1 Tax=Aspergillus novoparasiticus TaxID=986946 RepID=A0A5N6E7N8_9EURO|nr:hypothetical protein BDV33DRAFT_184948 [Aspergillus novoparasiticus]